MSSFGFSGSRTPPRLRLITRAPWSTAQRIAATSACERDRRRRRCDDLRDDELRVERQPRDALAVRRVGGDLARNERPVALRCRGTASRRRTTSRRRPGPSAPDAPPSIPESITATLIGKSFGGVGQNDQALSCSRYHCFAASGSVLSNASEAAGTASARAATASATGRLTAPRSWPRRRPRARGPARSERGSVPGASACGKLQAPLASVTPVARVVQRETRLLLQLNGRAGERRAHRPACSGRRDLRVDAGSDRDLREAGRAPRPRRADTGCRAAA